MYKTVARTKLIFLAIFAVLAAASWGYQYIWAWPAQRCAAKRGWWDVEHRVCAIPVDVSLFTHRPHGEKRTPEQKAVDQAAAAVAAEKHAQKTANPTANP